MFLAAYHFAGDPDTLTAAYRRMLAGFPPGTLELHVSVTTPDGLTVYDACPTREVFEEFSRGADLAAAIAAAGLPAPRVEPLGEIQNVVVGAGAATG
jgi:hypothetical protein